MKKLIKSFILIAVWLSLPIAKAHQPEISSVSLIEQESGTWIVQFNAGILGFQYAVEAANGKDSYSTVEEFNELLLVHLREKTDILINNEKVELTNGIVKLGHAATVVFELSEVPEELNKVYVQNEGFKSIHNSQSIFSIVKQGLDRDQFILSSDNDFQVEVVINDNLVLLANNTSGDKNMIPIAASIIAILAGTFFLKYRKSLDRSPFLSHN